MLFRSLNDTASDVVVGGGCRLSFQKWWTVNVNRTGIVLCRCVPRSSRFPELIYVLCARSKAILCLGSKCSFLWSVTVQRQIHMRLDYQEQNSLLLSYGQIFLWIFVFVVLYSEHYTLTYAYYALCPMPLCSVSVSMLAFRILDLHTVQVLSTWSQILKISIFNPWF